MIVFVGDVHAQFRGLEYKLRNVPKDATIIQVGDFGMYPSYQGAWDRSFAKMDRPPILFIDGNHEFHPYFEGITEPQEIWDGAIFIPRGSVMTFDGVKIGFLGGAASVDKSMRTAGIDWWPEETTKQADADRLLKNADGQVDVLVTHTLPNEMVQLHCNQERLEEWWGLPRSWIDPSAKLVEAVWNRLGRPPLFCGHFHKSIIDGNVRCLDILECLPYNVYGTKAWARE